MYLKKLYLTHNFKIKCDCTFKKGVKGFNISIECASDQLNTVTEAAEKVL